MSEPELQRNSSPAVDDGPGEPPGAPAQGKDRNPWIWVSAAVALVAVGLLIWGLSTQSELDRTEDDVSELQSQVSSESAESDAAKEVADDLAQDLGSTSDDLAATEEELSQAEQSAKQAEKDAAAAKEDAGQAQDATEKAEAEAEQARAETDAAESKTEIAGTCARAYLGAFGALFEGESAESQAPTVREDLESISAQCRPALSGG